MSYWNENNSKFRDDVYTRAVLATELAEVEGNLEKAVEFFEQVVATAEDNPELAAKAWLHIGACYERLGRQHQQEAVHGGQGY